jgi:uncharacterized protein (TIGR02145 family)
LKDGLVSGKKYVCENAVWRLASMVEASLGGCTMAVQGKVDNVGTSYYYCDNKSWRVATEYEADTFGWSCIVSNKGEIKKGNASVKIYVCENGTWRDAYYIEAKCYENTSCSMFTDTRDNQRYFYVVRGEQTWMAENLKYNVSGSKCGGDDGLLKDENTEICDKYGRLYDWATAMALPSSCNSNSCSDQIKTKHQGICPLGWHIPSYEEWTTLRDYDLSATKLRATSGWQGTDDYYFAALPSGSGLNDGRFNDDYGFWWNASEGGKISGTDDTSTFAYMVVITGSATYHYGSDKSSFHSIRCIKD